ncbi:hypothetical protein [Paenibacillus lutrae]|uniref:WGxxGxxG-CTERM domain-containing protein n=1 Tax=Paenibacillus lutrae TaxID=2078573 RepID=A0A7X3FI05_9BACL|nr:hypothetical protein [Paenibacillus lutrae]MVP00015.1 hypothetical protein [Paenibacillus lutrae]
MKRLFSLVAAALIGCGILSTAPVQAAGTGYSSSAGNSAAYVQDRSSYGSQTIHSGIGGSNGPYDPAEFSPGGIRTNRADPLPAATPKPGSYPPAKPNNVNMMQFDSKISPSAQKGSRKLDWMGFLGVLGLTGLMGKTRKKNFY